MATAAITQTFIRDGSKSIKWILLTLQPNWLEIDDTKFTLILNVEMEMWFPYVCHLVTSGHPVAFLLFCPNLCTHAHFS